GAGIGGIVSTLSDPLEPTSVPPVGCIDRVVPSTGQSDLGISGVGGRLHRPHGDDRDDGERHAEGDEDQERENESVPESDPASLCLRGACYRDVSCCASSSASLTGNRQTHR